MKAIRYLLVVTFFLHWQFAEAQNIISYYDEVSFEEADICESVPIPSSFNSAEAEVIVDDIMQRMGLARKFVLKACPNIKNAVALIKDGTPYILYDPDFIAGIRDKAGQDEYWINVAILAHEVGHHLLFHTLAPTNSPEEARQRELEADKFSGSMLRKMGATLEQAQLAVTTACREHDDTFSTHPARSKRLAAVQAGWQEMTADASAEEDFGLAATEDDRVWVEGGSFMMGCKMTRENMRRCDSDEKPVHEVHLDGFFIAKNEVTVGEFRTFVEATGYRTTAETKGGNRETLYKHAWEREGVDWSKDAKGNPLKTKANDLPVVNVSWDDAVAYCEWRSEQEGKVYRLPTEAEWEYAARGGADAAAALYAGGDDLNEVAWNSQNSGTQSHPVGRKTSNALGIHDMSGNVWEWCADGFGMYSPKVAYSPVGLESNKERLVRGGSWDSKEGDYRVINRHKFAADRSAGDLGFRWVCEGDD